MNVKYLIAKCGSGEKTAILLRELERLVCKFPYAVPNGWRFIVKLHKVGAERPYYCLDVQSNSGGGLRAEAKMYTMELFPERAATGNEELCDLIQMLDRLDAKILDEDDEVSQIYELESIGSLTEDLRIWLSHEIGIAPSYGGIRVPYEDIVVTGDEFKHKYGEIRLAFDGAATEEQNLCFALMMLKALNEESLPKNTQRWLNLRKLREIPAIRLWLDLLGIEEA